LIARSDAKEGLDRLRRAREALLKEPPQNALETLPELLRLAQAAQWRAKERSVRGQASALVDVVEDDILRLNRETCGEVTGESAGAAFKPRVDRVGFALVAAGVAALVGGMFLPLQDTTPLGLPNPPYSPPTVIASNLGFVFAALAVASAAEMARLRWRWRPSRWGLMIGVVAFLAPIVIASDVPLMRICNTHTFAVECQIADPGSGLYVVALGGLLMLVGWVVGISRAHGRGREPGGSTPRPRTGEHDEN
jgi:hypothetical protein